jgi:hypothetical protein
MRLSINYNKKSRRIVIVASYLLLAVVAAVFQNQNPHWRFDVIKNAFQPGYGASAISSEYFPEETLEIGNMVSSYGKDTRFYLSEGLIAVDFVFARTVEYIYPYRISCDYRHDPNHGCNVGVSAQPTRIEGGSHLVFAKLDESMAGCDLVKSGIKVRLYECPNR